MLFNSYQFIFVFLPVTASVFYLLTRYGLRDLSKLWVISASLVFYGWAVPWYLIVLLAALLIVLFCTWAMKFFHYGSRERFLLLLAGLFLILGNLFFWKYAVTLSAAVAPMFDVDVPTEKLPLPLGISFYTFTLALYLFDVYSDDANRSGRLDYFFFVLFFPALIAGPIVRQAELIPQLQTKCYGRYVSTSLIVGLNLFVIGLSKKVIFADNLALIVDPGYEAIASGEQIGAAAAWQVTLAYTAQLYFDFSGYSEMAIGLARIFGLQIPVNFFSPMQATSILDFWRRWHITLTRSATSFIFNPASLYLTRYFASKEYSKTLTTILITAPASLLTFVLIGLWHGPKVTFLLFGICHTFFAVAEYLWKAHKGERYVAWLGDVGKYLLARIVTFLLIVITLALFRAQSVDVFLKLLSEMFELSGIATVDIQYSLFVNIVFALSVLIMVLAPNSHQLLGRYQPGQFSYQVHRKASERYNWWRPGMVSSVIAGFAVGWCLFFMMSPDVVFLYFDF